jgi:GxxExxY protein
MDNLRDEELTKSVIGAFFEVYNILRYGFTELTYARSMEIELRTRGHRVAREKSVPVFYKTEVASTQRIDMIVDDRLVVEVKSTEKLPATALRQLYGYLRATELELGLLLHFGPEPKFYRQIVTNDQRPFNTDQKPTNK